MISESPIRLNFECKVKNRENMSLRGADGDDHSLLIVYDEFGFYNFYIYIYLGKKRTTNV